MADVWKALGDILGRAVGSLIKAIQGLMRWKPELLEEINRELAVGSIDPAMFKTEEGQAYARELRQLLKASPEKVSTWIRPALISFWDNIYDTLIKILIPEKAEDFEGAKNVASHLIKLYADFTALCAVLDTVATALSLTLVRNVVHQFRLYAATFGLNSLVEATINPAAYPAFLNVLRQGWNETYPTMIPGVTDLVRMEVREVWRPEFRDELLKPAPTGDFYAWMAKQGYNKFHADSYWASHWVLPSVGQGYDAYHRLPEFTLGDLKKLMVRLDILPFYQDMLIKLAWRLPGAIETRWMYRFGEIPVETIEDLLIKDGLDPEWAPRAARAIAKNQFTSEITKLVANAKADYVKGYSLEEQLYADLRALEIPEAWIEYHVADAVADRERAHKDDLVSIYVDAWRKDLIPDEETFRRDLETVIVQPEVVDNLVEREYIRKYKKPAPARETEEDKALERIRSYRVNMAVEEYRRYVTEKSELVTDLAVAGVDPAEAVARADYEEARRPIKKPTDAEVAAGKEARRLRTVEEKIAVEAFKKDVTTAEELVARLIELGESDAMAVAIAQLEILRKLSKPKVAA